jgi:hypothetical protein
MYCFIKTYFNALWIPLQHRFLIKYFIIGFDLSILLDSITPVHISKESTLIHTFLCRFSVRLCCFLLKSCSLRLTQGVIYHHSFFYAYGFFKLCLLLLESACISLLTTYVFPGGNDISSSIHGYVGVDSSSKICK